MKKANIKHVSLTYGYSKKTEDEQIYSLAIKEDRFIVTVDNDFKKIVKKNRPGIICIPSALSNQQMDDLLYYFVSNNSVSKCTGKVSKLTHEDLEFIKRKKKK